MRDYRRLITGGKLASDNTNLSIIPASETNLCLISTGPFSRCNPLPFMTAPCATWLGVPVSALDIAGALGLAVALRQLRGVCYDQHVTKAAPTLAGPRIREREDPWEIRSTCSFRRAPGAMQLCTRFCYDARHGPRWRSYRWYVDCLPIPRIFNLLFLPIKLCLPRVPYRPSSLSQPPGLAAVGR
jgi:hypothetical protein